MRRSAHNPWLHRYATFVAFATYLLIIAGALVTSNDAGLSVPDWPTSFGSFSMPRMVGGVKFEHGHRMIAGFVGILTILLVLWLWAKDSRRWLRWVGFGAVMAVIAQAVLGGITVLFDLPAPISTAHATLGQIFFCLTSSLAFFTGADWRWDEPKRVDHSSPSLQHLTMATTAAILVQLILGAAYRHAGLGVAPHIVGACVVTALSTWVVVRVLKDFSHQPRLARPAVLLGSLLLVQLVLGIGSYFMIIATANAGVTMRAIVDITSAHVAVGALLLLSSLHLTYQSYRFLTLRAAEGNLAAAPQKATT
jgi:cytochrome c oxidase assembly protein subunit 15